MKPKIWLSNGTKNISIYFMVYITRAKSPFFTVYLILQFSMTEILKSSVNHPLHRSRAWKKLHWRGYLMLNLISLWCEEWVSDRLSSFVQLNSFEVELPVPALASQEGGSGTCRAVFIRAPAIVGVGPSVEVLAEYPLAPGQAIDSPEEVKNLESRLPLYDRLFSCIWILSSLLLSPESASLFLRAFSKCLVASINVVCYVYRKEVARKRLLWLWSRTTC